MKNPLRILLAAAGLLAAGILLFGRAPQNGRILEDELAIWSNPAVSGPSWGEALAGRFYESRKDGFRPAIRPVPVLLHRVEFGLIGQARAGFVWVSVVLLACCAAVFLLTLCRCGHSLRTAALGGLLLLVHPIASASVLSLAGSSELLALLFCLVTLHLVQGMEATDAAQSRSRPGKPAIGAAAVLLLAILSNEIGLAFAGAIILWFLARRSRIGMRPVATFLGVVSMVLLYRVAVLSTLPHHLKIGRAVDTATGLAWSHRALTGLTGVTEFIRVAFIPWRLPYANDFLGLAPAVPIRAALGTLLLVASIGATIWLFRRAQGAALWSAWSLLALIGACGFVVPTSSLVPPRLFVAALPGLIALVLHVAARIGAQWDARTRAILGTAMAIAVALPLGARTALRVRDYQDWETLVGRQTVDFPQSALGWFDRGNIDLTRGNNAGAIHFYEKATSIRPEYWPAWINMGAAYAGQEERGLAVRAYEKALEATKGKPELRVLEARASFNRALMLMTQVRNLEAARGFENMLEVFPDHLTSHANLGMIYSNSPQLDDKATGHLNRALQMEKDADRQKLLQDFLEGIQKRRERLNRTGGPGAEPDTSVD